MPQTEVLVIGCGISGCTAAIELAKRDIPVTLISCGSEARQSSSSLADRSPELSSAGSSEQLMRWLKEKTGDLGCPRAVQQLSEQGPAYLQDFVQAELELDLHTRPVGPRVIDALLKRIDMLPQVTVLTGHTAVELITLGQHSEKPSDIYKKPTCVGAYVLDHKTGEIQSYLAKETILATGGLGDVFLNTTNPSDAKGHGFVLAQQAGARLINLRHIHFHPLSLWEEGQRCWALPPELWAGDAKILDENKEELCRADAKPVEQLVGEIYQRLQQKAAHSFWLDLSHADSDAIQARYPLLTAHCSKQGLDFPREPLPITPAAHYCVGGVAVDRTGQSTVSRLRAIGEVACSGAQGTTFLSPAAMLEGMVWAKSCAEDVAKQVKRFAYYFPPIKEKENGGDLCSAGPIQQDWLATKQIMWNYAGPIHDPKQLRRALKGLRVLQEQTQEFYQDAKLTPELLGLKRGLDVAQLVVEDCCQREAVFSKE